MIRRALLAGVLVVGCSTPSTPMPHPSFPEMPALEALVPPEPALFRQETWTGTTQHCWESGFDRADYPAVVASLHARIRAAGWEDAAFEREPLRHDGAVVLAMDYVRLDPLEHGEIAKVMVCTEHRGSEEASRAFFAALAADPLSLAFPFGAPAVGWRRVYKNGARAIGMAFSLDDQAAARRFFESAGYSVVAQAPTLELRDGHGRARFLGLLWWQREDRAP